MHVRGESLGAVDDCAHREPSRPRLAYLLSRYPAISHTFLLQEVLGLRERGFHIETASINPTDRSLSNLPSRERKEAETTYYLKGGSRSLAAWTLVRILLRQPAAVFRGLSTICAIRTLTVSRRFYWLLYLAEALLLGRWMKERSLTHLHVHFGGPVASVGLLASAAWRVPFSMTIHGPEELLDLTSTHLRQKVERATFVFCISDFCRSQLCSLVPQQHWRKFHVLRLGVDPAVLSPEIQLLRTNGGGMLKAVCIGRLVPAKGHRTLLEALLMLRDRAVAMHLVLIGGGPEMQHLQDFVQTHQLADCVTFTDALSHEEALAHLRQADLFVLASFAEGIPVALMEAMALGIPCISTFVAGIPELIRDGVDGLLVPPGNAQALAEALLMILEESSRRVAIGEAARRKVVKHYNLRCNQEQLARTFEQLLLGETQPVPVEAQT